MLLRKKKKQLKQNKPRLRGAGLGSRLYSCFPLSFLLGFPIFLKFCWTLSLVPFVTGNLWFSFFFLNGSWRESERDMWSWRATAASVMFDWKAKSTGLIIIITGNIIIVWIIIIIKFSTSDNAFRVFWLVHSILVISSYTLVWPYMLSACAKPC